MPLSVLGIALTIVFGCILLGLVAELFYLLWWKKRRTCIGIEIGEESNEKGSVLYGVCWKTPSTNNPTSVAMNQENLSDEEDLELGTKVSNDMVVKSLGEEGVESELMRLHNLAGLAGPPRFLFTITEETKEDLESEDRSRKGSRTRSLSDIMVAINTPLLSPVACSPMKCSLENLDSYKNQGFNPLFESSGESDFNRFRSSSPPPKFKFLRDAEEKLYRRLIHEAQRKAQKNHQSVVPESEVKDYLNSTRVTEERDMSLLRFINNKEKEQRELQQHLKQFPSSTSQVLPLASSPTTFRPVENSSILH